MAEARIGATPLWPYAELRHHDNTGIPTGIGIGQTKTLAKLANFVAKSADRKPGSYTSGFAPVCNLAALPASDLYAVLEATNLDEIWGIAA